MCRTMCPDIFMENVVGFLRVFSVSLMGLSLPGVRRPLRLVWALHPSYSVCENQLMSLHLARPQTAFSNHVQRPPISFIVTYFTFYLIFHCTMVLCFSHCFIWVSSSLQLNYTIWRKGQSTRISCTTSIVPHSMLGMLYLL